MIIDAPPLNPVADTQALLDSPAIHATLMVGRINLTTRDEVQRARAILDLHMVDPIGIAVTGLRDTDYYGYNTYAAAEPTLDVETDSRPPVSAGTRTRTRAKRAARGVEREQDARATIACDGDSTPRADAVHAGERGDGRDRAAPGVTCSGQSG